MVQNAIREAARLGHLTVEERRREGRRNLPNVVRIISKEWTGWLAGGGRAGGGGAVEPPASRTADRVQKITPTDSRYKNQRSRTSEPVIAARGQQAGSAAPHHRRPSYG